MSYHNICVVANKENKKLLIKLGIDMSKVNIHKWNFIDGYYYCIDNNIARWNKNPTSYTKYYNKNGKLVTLCDGKLNGYYIKASREVYDSLISLGYRPYNIFSKNLYYYEIDNNFIKGKMEKGMLSKNYKEMFFVNDKFLRDEEFFRDGIFYADKTFNKINYTRDSIKQDTVVKASRDNDNDNYTWQGKYWGEANGKFLIDFNGTHVMVADKIEIFPTLTKKEAKQKVSELFSNKASSSQQIRDIIDLIEDKEC